MAILWKPKNTTCQMMALMEYLNARYEVNLRTYEALHQWSVEHLSEFWGALWHFFDVQAHVPYDRVLDEGARFMDAAWFVGGQLNFAENLLRFQDDGVALVAVSEKGETQRVRYNELYSMVERMASWLQSKGVQKGDRVAAYIPNIPEAVVLMLAATALGAIWTSTSPDFGAQSVIDRFGQVDPKVFITVDGYMYNGKPVSIEEKATAVAQALGSVESVLIIPYLGTAACLQKKLGGDNYQDILSQPALSPLTFVPVPSDHPLYILYSSGTTGRPKTIVHRTAGTLIQHLKEHRLHTDLGRDDVLFYYTTTGWMMWNWLVSGLASGATLVLYEGAATYPSVNRLWQLIDDEKITIFGTSAKFLALSEVKSIHLKEANSLIHLRAILSTGSVLPPGSFDYVYQHIKDDIMLGSISGGTDIVSCFALSCPIKPVVRGESQCVGLGMDVKAYNAQGEPVYDQMGELVCCQPFPSMPLGFWCDEDGERYRKAYFDVYQDVWHHGDAIIITSQGGVIFLGRSDATLNPGGVRIGSAEIYAVAESLPEIKDSLIVGQRWREDERVVMFVQLHEGHVLDTTLRKKIKHAIREQCTARHVPAILVAVKEVPYTMNGKKVEVAVKRVLHGEAVENESVLRNPGALVEYRDYYEKSLG